MPLTPITGSLFDVNYVQVQYPVLAARLANMDSPPPVACADNPRKKRYLSFHYISTNSISAILVRMSSIEFTRTVLSKCRWTHVRML